MSNKIKYKFDGLNYQPLNFIQNKEKTKQIQWIYGLCFKKQVMLAFIVVKNIRK
jgi:hypothetical protein